MPSYVSLRLVVAAVVSVSVLVGCSGDDSDEPEQPESSQQAPLEPRWSTSLGEGDLSALVSALDDERILYKGQDNLVTALDTSTGKPLWRRRIAGICRVSDPNAAGDVALTLGKECRDVAVLEGETGEQRWRTHVPTVSPQYDAGDVIASIGDRTVTVIQFCGQVTRLSLRDGRRIGVLARHDRACANDADSDGQVIALWLDPETAATPDDHGTGWIPSWDGLAAFELYDADSGRLLWRRRTDRRNAGLSAGAVVSSDPLLLTLHEDGHTAMRRYTRSTPKPGAYVGRQPGSYDGAFLPIGVADGVVVGTYGSATTGEQGDRLFAYDLATEHELWSRATPHDTAYDPRPAGVDRHGVVLTQPTSERDASGELQNQTWVTRWDLRTGEDLGAVGWVETDAFGSSLWSVENGLLLSVGSRLDAFELPEPDPELAPPGDDGDWAEREIRPDPLVDPCTAVRPPALRLAGLSRSANLPEPADCAWLEHDLPAYSDRGLRVEVTIAEPDMVSALGSSSTGNTATENARALMKQTLKSFEPSVTSAMQHPPMPKPEPLDGVGDEAYATSGAVLSGGSGSAAGSYLLVRQRNVIVEVAAEGAYRLAYRGSGPPSVHDSESAVLAAARDVFAGLDLQFDVPRTPPDDGPYDRTRGVCDELRDDAAALGLDESPPIMPAGSGPRAAECSFEEDAELGDELTIQAYAAAGSPMTGDTGREVAERMFDASPAAEPVKGLADRAVIERDDFTSDDGSTNSERTVTARVANLVVKIDYSRWGAGLGADAERNAVRVAREVLRAIPARH